MSIAFICFGWMLLFTTPFAVELSIWMGVGDWGCPISARMFLMYTNSFVLIHSTLSSASAADDMTALMTCDMLIMALLGCGMFSSFARKNHPALLLACGIFL